jgi:hypothetical protein
LGYALSIEKYDNSGLCISFCGNNFAMKKQTIHFLMNVVTLKKIKKSAVPGGISVFSFWGVK